MADPGQLAGAIDHERGRDDEYLRSHLAKLGTHTDMKRVVAQLIPPSL
jgi:hypothetical protein